MFLGSFYLINLMLAVVSMSYEEEASNAGKVGRPLMFRTIIVIMFSQLQRRYISVNDFRYRSSLPDN